MLLTYILKRLPFINPCAPQSVSASFTGKVSISDAELDVNWLNTLNLPFHFHSVKCSLLQVNILKTSLFIKDIAISASPTSSLFSLFNSTPDDVSSDDAFDSSGILSFLSPLIESLLQKLASVSIVEIDGLVLSMVSPCQSNLIECSMNRLSIMPQLLTQSSVHHFFKKLEISKIQLSAQSNSISFNILNIMSLECLFSFQNSLFKVDTTVAGVALEFCLSTNVLNFVDFLSSFFTDWELFDSDFAPDIVSVCLTDSELLKYSKILDNEDFDVVAESFDSISNLMFEFQVTIIDCTVSFGLADCFGGILNCPKILISHSTQNFDLQVSTVTIQFNSTLVLEVDDLSLKTIHDKSIKFDCNHVFVSSTILQIRNLLLFQSLLSLLSFKLQHASFLHQLIPSKSSSLQSKSEPVNAKISLFLNNFVFLISSPSSPRNFAFIKLNQLTSSIDSFQSILTFDFCVGLTHTSDFNSILEDSEDLWYFCNKINVDMTFLSNDKQFQSNVPIYPPQKVYSDCDGPGSHQSFDDAPSVLQLESDYQSFLTVSHFYENNSQKQAKISISEAVFFINNSNGTKFSNLLHLLNSIVSVDLPSASRPHESKFYTIISENDIHDSKAHSIVTDLTWVNVSLSSFKLRVGCFDSYLTTVLTDITCDLFLSCESTIFFMVKQIQIFSNTLNFPSVFDSFSDHGSNVSNISDSELAEFVSPLSSPLSGPNTPNIKNINNSNINNSNANVQSLFYSFLESVETKSIPCIFLSVHQDSHSINQIRLRLSNIALNPPNYSDILIFYRSFVIESGIFKYFKPTGPELMTIEVPPQKLNLDIILVDCFSTINFAQRQDQSVCFLIEGSRVFLTFLILD
ncbi:hypothetical protein GEMRC1_001695 [Eukaryota sp. GEM-RC1]